jgi:RimJ/RimL family protein N-acetyltransferase
MLNDIQLMGNRVQLKPLTKQHTAHLFQAGSDEEIWRYSSKKIKNIEEMDELVDEALENKMKGLEYPFVIIDNSSGSIVGSTRYLNISLIHRNLEIGWTWLNPSIWRTFVNTECKFLLLKYAFESLSMVRVQFKTDIRNVRSNIVSLIRNGLMLI